MSSYSACFVMVDSLEVLALALLSNYKSSAVVLELDNPAIEFEAMIRGELLMVLGQEFGFLELLLLEVSKGLVPKEERVVSLEACNAKVWVLVGI